MALNVNKVLTATYHAAYDDALEGDELVLLTAPLSATTEIQALHDSGIIDIESALPAALHSLGASAVEIEGAMKRRREADRSGTDSKAIEAQMAAQVGDADSKLKAAQAAKTTEEIEAVRAGVRKTEAEIKHMPQAAKVAKVASATNAAAAAPPSSANQSAAD